MHVRENLWRWCGVATKVMRRPLWMLVLLTPSLLIALSCTASTPPSTTNPDISPFWITASWSGGRTGSPLNVNSQGPTAFEGSACAPDGIETGAHIHKARARAC